MPRDLPRAHKKDSSTGWLMLGTLAALGSAAAFLVEMAGKIQVGGAGGGGPILIVAMLGAGIFLAAALGPIGKAVGRRLLEGGVPEDDGVMQEEVHDLRLQVDDLRQALAETQERLDFTERMLSSGRERTPEELH
jgi:hypothetical protein